MLAGGANNPGARWTVKLAGGASVIRPGAVANAFDVGKRNVLACKKALWKNGMGVEAEALGGNIPRSFALEVGTTETVVTTAWRPNLLI